MAGSDLRKARQYELQAHEDEIRRHITLDGWKLKQIQTHFVDEHGLYATENMWKKLFKKLGLRLKKNRFEVMEAAAQHYQTCLDTNTPFLYIVPQHKPINAEELWRYARRSGYNIVNGQFVRRDSVTSSPTIKTEHTVDVDINSLDDAHSMDTSEDEMILTPIEMEDPFEPLEEVKRQEDVEIYFKTEEIDYPSGCIIVSPAASTAHAYLNQAGYARSPSITLPDIFFSRESLLRALDLATAGSFDSGRVEINRYGWAKVTEDTFRAIDRSGEIYCHFEDAGRLSQRGRMHKAWRHYRAGLSCLFFGLEHCFPLAISSLFWACGKLYAARLEHMVKILAWHTTQWCQQSCQPPEVTEIFASLYKTEESQTVQTLIDAQKVTWSQLRDRTSELHPGVFRSRIDIIRMETLHDPQNGIDKLLRELAAVKNMTYARIEAELYLLSEISDVCGLSGEYETGLEIAQEGLRKSSEEESSVDPDFALVFAKDVVAHSRNLGQGHRGLARINQLLTSVLAREAMYRSDLVVTLLEEVIFLQKELGNEHELAIYKGVVNRVQNSGMDELEEALQNLGFDSTEPPPAPVETTNCEEIQLPNQQQAWVSDRGDSPPPDPIWRTDVPSDMRDHLVLPGIDL